METIKIVLFAIGLLALAMAGLGLNILLKKGGKFPNTHVSGNPYLKSKGITCIQTYDRMEQEKAKKEIDYNDLKVTEKE